MLLGARQDCVAGGATIPEKMSILKARGYDFLELALTRDEISMLPSELATTYTAATASTDLPILSTSMGHFGGFAALSDADRTRVLRDIRSLIAFTHAIGADTILLATREDAAEVKDYAPVYREHLRAVADEARDAGVMLALEHVGWYKPYQLAELVQAIDHPAVRIYFDMGNCLYVGENPLEQARICGPLAGQLHIKGGPTTPLAAMPLVQVREILAAVGFNGRGCLEIPALDGDRHLAEARALLHMAGYC